MKGTSAAKQSANQANAKHSTGPRSEAGKQRVSQNARRHGFTGSHFFCPEPLEPMLQEIETAYRATLRPQGFLEEDAFLQLRNARFNMERAQILMDDLGRKATAPDLDPLADPQLCKRYLLYQRYFNQAQAAFHRYLRLLRQLQAERPPQPQPVSVPLWSPAQVAFPSQPSAAPPPAQRPSPPPAHDLATALSPTVAASHSPQSQSKPHAA